MNAGWTKVWAVLFPDRFIMYDSRVASVLCRFLRSYLDDNGVAHAPPEIALRQLVRDGPRHVPGLGHVYHRPRYHAASMSLASRICLALLDVANTSQDGEVRWWRGMTLRQFEAAVFMLAQGQHV